MVRHGGRQDATGRREVADRSCPSIRIRAARVDATDRFDRRGEDGRLPIRAVDVLRGGQVRPDTGKLGERAGVDLRHRGRDFRGRDAATPKTRLDLQVKRQSGLWTRRSSRGSRRQGRKRPRQERAVADGQCQAGFGRDRGTIRRDRVQDEDRQAHAGRPEGQSFVEGGHAQAVRAAPLQPG